MEVRVQVTRPASAGLERGAGWLPERRIVGSHQMAPAPPEHDALKRSCLDGRFGALSLADALGVTVEETITV